MSITKNSFRNLYLDIHILQVLPPSNLNRGQDGAPKTAQIGGTTRARLSSQSQKRPARLDFNRNAENYGIRTRMHVEEITNRLKTYGIEDKEAKTLAEKANKVGKLGSDKDDAKSTIVFLSSKQFDNIASVMAKYHTSKVSDKELEKQLKEAIMADPSVDQLLFGRMFANDPSLDYDAAAQVMHAYSVNAVRYEFDYFSAVDDLAQILTPEKGGAGHIDSKLFVDPILYRYANVNLSESSELIKFDRENAAVDAAAFAEAFIMNLPTGSTNSFAACTLPSYVLLTLRDDKPVNFSPAFIKAVASDDYLGEAIQKIEEERNRIDRLYGSAVFAERLDDKPLKDILKDVISEIEKRL